MYSNTSLALLAMCSVAFGAGHAPRQPGQVKRVISISPAAMPAMRFIRDVDNGCQDVEVDCGGYCFDQDSICCPNKKVACDVRDGCELYPDGEYGCCAADCGSGVDNDGPSPTDEGDGPNEAATSVPTGDSDNSSSSDDDSDPATTGDVAAIPSRTGIPLTASDGGLNPTLLPKLSDVCVSAISEIMAQPSPTVAPDLANAFGAAPDFCNFTPPASLSSEWKSYTKVAMSWIKDNKDILDKLEKNCDIEHDNLNLPACVKSSKGGSSGGSSGGSDDSSDNNSGDNSGDKSDGKSDDNSDSGAGSLKIGNGVVAAVAVVGLAAVLL